MFKCGLEGWGCSLDTGSLRGLLFNQSSEGQIEYVVVSRGVGVGVRRVPALAGIHGGLPSGLWAGSASKVGALGSPGSCYSLAEATQEL